MHISLVLFSPGSGEADFGWAEELASCISITIVYWHLQTTNTIMHTSFNVVRSVHIMWTTDATKYNHKLASEQLHVTPKQDSIFINLAQIWNWPKYGWIYKIGWISYGAGFGTALISSQHRQQCRTQFYSSMQKTTTTTSICGDSPQQSGPAHRSASTSHAEIKSQSKLLMSDVKCCTVALSEPTMTTMITHDDDDQLYSVVNPRCCYAQLQPTTATFLLRRNVMQSHSWATRPRWRRWSQFH